MFVWLSNTESKTLEVAWQGERMMYTCKELKVQKNRCSGISEVQDSVSNISSSRGYLGRWRKPAQLPCAGHFPCTLLASVIIGLWTFGAAALPSLCLWTCWPWTCLLPFWTSSYVHPPQIPVPGRSRCSLSLVFWHSSSFGFLSLSYRQWERKIFFWVLKSQECLLTSKPHSWILWIGLKPHLGYFILNSFF